MKWTSIRPNNKNDTMIGWARPKTDYMAQIEIMLCTHIYMYIHSYWTKNRMAAEKKHCIKEKNHWLIYPYPYATSETFYLYQTEIAITFNCFLLLLLLWPFVAHHRFKAGEAYSNCNCSNETESGFCGLKMTAAYFL